MRPITFVIIMLMTYTGLACAQSNGEISTTVYIEPGNMLVLDAWADESTRAHQVIEGPATIGVTYQPYQAFYITYTNAEGEECTVQHYPPLQENLIPFSEADLRMLFSLPKYQRIFQLPWVAEHLTNPENIMSNDIAVLKDAYLQWELRWREVKTEVTDYAHELYNSGTWNADEVAQKVAAFMMTHDDIVRSVRIDSKEVIPTGTIIHVHLEGYGEEQFMIGTNIYNAKAIEAFTPDEACQELKSLELLSQSDTRVRIHLNYGNNGDRQTGELAEKRIREEE